MTKLIFSILPLAFVGLAIAGPADPKAIPNSADWFFHVDMDKLAQGTMAELLGELDDEAENPMRFFEIQDGRTTGGFTLYGSITDPEDTVLIMSGMNRDELIEEVSDSKKYKTEEYKDYTIHSWNEKTGNRRGDKQKVTMAFIDKNSAIVTARQKVLLEALDLHEKGGNDSREALGDGAIVGNVNVDAIRQEVDPEAALFDLAKEIEFSVQLTEDDVLVGAFHMKSANQDRADRLRRMVDGMVAFASEAAEHEGLWAPDENFEIEQDGKVIEVRFTIPVKELKRMMFDRDLII
ncbi:MAG: hypothetical protein AAF585_15215 [Verrucomicrobiota bacterium]